MLNAQGLVQIQGNSAVKTGRSADASSHLKVVGAPMPNHLCAEFARIAEEERKKEADAEQQGKFFANNDRTPF